MLLRYSAHPRDGIKLSERLWVKVWYPGKLGIALLKHRLLKHQVARIGFNPSRPIGCETSEFNCMKRRPRHPLHSKSTLRLTQRIHASLTHKGGNHFCPGWFQRCNPHLKSACRESNPIGLLARSKNSTHVKFLLLAGNPVVLSGDIWLGTAPCRFRWVKVWYPGEPRMYLF